MRVIALQSGSNGNCIHVETRGVSLVFDAGISGKQALGRLAAAGGDICLASGVVISHDHADHVRSAGIFQRKFGLPIYATAETYRAAAARCSLGNVDDVRTFCAGASLEFGPVRVETIPTPHDGADGTAFVIDDGRRRFGILTDLGHVFDGLGELIASLDAVLLESNYDPQMLSSGPYPAVLKRRIRGPGGHISNVESAELLATWAGRRLKWACLGHLSEHNNCPELAMQTHRQIVGNGLGLHIASRYGSAGPFDV